MPPAGSPTGRQRPRVPPTRLGRTISTGRFPRYVWGLPVLILVVTLLAACGGQEPSPTPGALERGIAAMEVTSPAFKDGGTVPVKYSCEGEDVSPPIAIGPKPPQTRSLALLMDDPDAPGGTFVHWIAFDLDGDRHELKEGLGGEEERAAEGKHGVNGFGRLGYGGPCPPAGLAHTYRFMVYALDRKLDLEAGATVNEVLAAMRGNVLGLGQLEGSFGRGD